MNWIEWIGYAASLAILISLIMTSVFRLRLINLGGAILFVIYGLLIKAYPVAFMNGAIAMVNIYYLRQMLLAREDYFSVLEISPSSRYLQQFLNFYIEDIRKFIPGFCTENVQKDECWILLRDMKVAGVFMGSQKGDKTLEVHLDYILPEYRDLKAGKFLYETNKEVFLKKSYEKLIAPKGNEKHNKYLKKMGFDPVNSHFEKALV